MTITVDTMKPKLHTLEHVGDLLAATEPLSTHGFSVGAATYQISPGWHHGIDAKTGTEPVDATIAIGAHEFALTKDALLEAASICGIRKEYAARCPAFLLEPQLNYWFGEDEGLRTRRSTACDYQILVAAGNAAAITRSTVQPFSNLRLLEQALDAIDHRYGGTSDVLVDYKFVHTLRRTHLRLIIPEQVRTMEGTGTDNDEWSIGIQLRNSLTGEDRTSLDGYLFRWTCTNGAIDTHTTSGAWTRRGGSEHEVYDWARTAVDDILGGLEPALDAVQALVAMPIDGTANDILRDVFATYRVPLAERSTIIENMIETGGNFTMYAVMNAITQAANDPRLDPTRVENLLRMGGDLPHTAASRCDACCRLLPH